jgi:hypothetical protein
MLQRAHALVSRACSLKKKSLEKNQNELLMLQRAHVMLLCRVHALMCGDEGPCTCVALALPPRISFFLFFKSDWISTTERLYARLQKGCI